MRYRKLIGVVAGLALVRVMIGGQIAKAQEIWGDETIVIVTANRVPSLLSKTPASVSVVTKEQIKASGAKTVADVVALLPGVAIRPQGSMGALVSPVFRGSDPKQVLILIDGIPMNDQRQGTVDLSVLPVDNIERIEVVRGPASSLYGANAMGGVINIITGGAGRKQSFSVLTGDHGTQGYKLSASSAIGGGRLQLLMGRALSDGWRANSDFDGWNGTLRMDWKAAGWKSLSAGIVGYTDDKGLPGSTFYPSPFDRMKDKNLLARVTGERQISAKTSFLSTLYASSGELDYHGVDWMGSPVNDTHKTKAYGGEFQFNTSYDAANTFLYGVDTRRETVDSTSLVTRFNATTLGLFAEDEIKYGDDVLRIGGRLDSHSDYGGQFNPRVGYMHKLSRDSRLRASIGRAFRAPTFNELFWPYTDFGYGFTYQGNPNLKPERAWAADLGIEQRLGSRSVVKVTGFSSRVHDMIASGTTMPVNVGSAAIDGLEVEFNHRLWKNGTLFANYTTLSATDRATGSPLIRIPDTSLNVGLIAPLHRGASVAITSRWVGERWDWGQSNYPATMTRLPVYNVMDVKLSCPVHSGINVTVSVENMFDRQYADIIGYPMPGRSVHFGIESGL